MRYESMRLLCMFDLPMETIQDKRVYRYFKKLLVEQGFERLQYSVYYRTCPNRSFASKFHKKLKEAIVLGGRSYYESTAKEHAHLIDTESGEIYDIDLPVVKVEGIPAGFSAQKISLNIYGTFKKSP